MVYTIQRTDRNLKAISAHSCRQSPVRDEGHIKNLPAMERAFTIFRGLHEAADSRHACNRYAQEARRPPQVLMHKTDVHSINGIMQKPEDIVFTKVDANWMHHLHTDDLVIKVRIANSIVHKMLVDNGSAANIIF